MASNNVLWELTKNYNSYLTTKANKVFSKDPFNLTNKNIFKYSGVAHERSIGLNVDLEKTEKGYKRHFNIDMKRKKRYASAKNVMPEKNTSRFITRNTVKRDVNATATAIKSLKLFRPDLHESALKRLKALHDSSVISIKSKTIKKK